MRTPHAFNRRILVAVTGATVVATSLAAATGTAFAHDSGGSGHNRWQIRQLIHGLDAPRGIAVDASGGVYVAQSGATGAGAVGLTQGSVTKYRWQDGGLERKWSRGFTGVYASENPNSPPDALGPAGLSVACTSRDSDHQSAQCDVYMIDSSNHDEVLATGGPAVPDIGHLFRLDGRTGRSRSVSDVGDTNYQWTADHKNLWQEFPDANPYGVFVMGTHHGRRIFVADAGANTISEVLRNGSSRVISYIPNEAVAGNGNRDATPTCIARGPDGMLYVGALDLLSNLAKGGGQSIVWRVDPNSTDWAHNATAWATGFTTITSCMFDRHGNFWATEMFANNGAGAPPGDVATTSFWDRTHHITRIGGGRLALPGGIAQAHDGSIFVTTGSSAPNGGGGVARLTLMRAD